MMMLKPKQPNKRIKYFILSQYDYDNNHNKHKKLFYELQKVLKKMDKIELEEFQANDPFEGFLSRIKRCIDSSDVVISILDDYNPNMFQELGICVGLGKKPIIITYSDRKQISDQMPFLSLFSLIEYPSEDFHTKLLSLVQENAKISSDHEFSNGPESENGKKEAIHSHRKCQCI